jgi:hypothetical protein
VVSEHLRQRSLDSQLIRLSIRFAGIAIAIGLLIQGSYELGFPTYSGWGLAVWRSHSRPRTVSPTSSVRC